MWGPATAIAISEMQRHAEESVSRVRAELSRLECSDIIFVRQTNHHLKLTYGDMCLVAEPSALLTILREINKVGHVEDFWATLADELGKQYECVWLRMKVLVALLLSILAFVFVILI